MIYLKNITLRKYQSLVDKTLRMTIDTQELSKEEVAEIHELSTKVNQRFVLIIVTEEQLAEIKNGK